MNGLDLVSRWVHVGSAIVLLGGAFYVRFILFPAARQLPEEAHNQLRQLVAQRWKRVLHLGIVLLLLTGFYNYLSATPVDAFRKQYHMLMGIKILLSLVVFFVASVLVGRSNAFARWRQNPKRALGLVVLLGAVIVGIAGYLRVQSIASLRAELPPAPVEAAAPTVQAR